MEHLEHCPGPINPYLPHPIKIRHTVERQLEDQLTASCGPTELLFCVRQTFPCTHHAPEDVLQSVACFAQRAIKTIFCSNLALGRRQGLLARRFHAHRFPSHRDIRPHLRAFIVIAQSLTGYEQALGNMAAPMEPAERGFGEIAVDGGAFAFSA